MTLAGAVTRDVTLSTKVTRRGTLLPISDSPGTEFKVAIAGPLVTLAIVVALTAGGLAAAGADEFRRAALVQSTASTSGVLAMIAWLASINLLVLVFNLLPAFPMDGGRVTRAIAWKVSPASQTTQSGPQ